MNNENSTLIWQGPRSTVHLETANGEEIVRKIYKYPDDLSIELAIYNLLSNTNLKNIPKVISHGKYYLLLSHINGTSLRDFVNSHTDKDIFHYFCSKTEESDKIKRQLLETIKSLHNNGVAHGNLKQSQFIVDSQNNLYIFDFAGSVTTDHPYFNVYKKYDLDVLRSYLEGIPAKRPKRLTFFLARFFNSLSRFYINKNNASY